MSKNEVWRRLYRVITKKLFAETIPELILFYLFIIKKKQKKPTKNQGIVR